tara:strand:- start:2740 stop:3048 length:309 start_codon:yes stop_codon:yes gene_type:complete
MSKYDGKYDTRKHTSKYYETHGNWDNRYSNTGVGTGTPKGYNPATWDSSCPLCGGQQRVISDQGHSWKNMNRPQAEVECKNCGAVQEISGGQTVLKRKEELY